MRIGMLTSVRLLGEAIALALAAREDRFDTVFYRSVDELREAVEGVVELDLVIVDTTQPVDLQVIRQFHRDFPELPLLALGLREREAEVIAHGAAGFAGYLPREDGMERLCTRVEDTLAGRLELSPEIAAAVMRGLFRSAPLASPHAPGLLTRREGEVAQLVGRALSNKEIARELQVSESTVKHHVHSILGKLGLYKRAQLMRGPPEGGWGRAGGRRLHG